MTEQAMLAAVLGRSERTLYVRTSQLFQRLLMVQWLAAIVLALVLSPYGWAGQLKTIHIHVLAALILGGLLNTLPLVLLRTSPDSWLTRHVVAIAQMLWSALLIAITGGRIETHFHIFVSLAFLALYRDWRVLLTASLAVACDHLARGLFWPESVYGIANPEWWRTLEHGGWVVFEDIVLSFACVKSRAEMRLAAEREVALEQVNSDIECQVALRTNELQIANASLADEMRSRLQLEVELRQAQKLESVGRLSAGIAHEINTPIQFVSDSMFFVREAVTNLFQVVESLDSVRRSVQDGLPAQEAARAAAAAEEEADLGYLRSNVPQALDRAMDGLDRVAVIVRAMKEFAHPDQKNATPIDLNQSIRSTLTIAASEYKYVAEVSTDLAQLPPVVCHAGDLNQAILNVIVNAAHAIGDVVAGTDSKGTIHVRTWQDGDDVVISVADSGGGMASDVREHIFEPFFTTKEVGRGTGQGLALTRSIIVDKHRGKISFETELGTGTTFFLRLPINGAADTASPASAKHGISELGDSAEGTASHSLTV
ncbi:MAG: ATP-binding protein [Polyangiaceae bacterium]